MNTEGVNILAQLFRQVEGVLASDLEDREKCVVAGSMFQEFTRNESLLNILTFQERNNLIQWMSMIKRHLLEKDTASEKIQLLRSVVRDALRGLDGTGEFRRERVSQN